MLVLAVARPLEMSRAEARTPVVPVPVVASAEVSPSDHCLAAPVDGPLLESFVEPACPYCAGRRTIGFAARTGDAVRAPAGGRIHFSGSVVGSAYVTIVPDTDPSMLVTVGGVEPEPTGFRAGAPPREILGPIVGRGQVIGIATGPVGLSLRQQASSGPPTYLDPEPYLARWRVRARLIPLDGAAGRHPDKRFGCRRALEGGAPGRHPG